MSAAPTMTIVFDGRRSRDQVTVDLEKRTVAR